MNEELRKKLENKIQQEFDAHSIAALFHVSPLAEMLNDSPDRAIDGIFAAYNDALNEAYTDGEGQNLRGFVESFAGGPLEVIPSAIYNAVGAVYPYLERPQRDRALRQVLNILDGVNTRYVQESHAPFIREPLLSADIYICRWPYYPGFEEGARLAEQFQTFEELKSELLDERGMFRKNKVRSDFLVAAGLMHQKYSPWGDEYIAAANPEFLRRAFKGIVAIDFADVSEQKAIARTNEFNAAWPEAFCKQLEALRKEKDWVDYPNFK